MSTKNNEHNALCYNPTSRAMLVEQINNAMRYDGSANKAKFIGFGNL
jgi:hypothetical protein